MNEQITITWENVFDLIPRVAEIADYGDVDSFDVGLFISEWRLDLDEVPSEEDALISDVAMKVEDLLNMYDDSEYDEDEYDPPPPAWVKEWLKVAEGYRII